MVTKRYPSRDGAFGVTVRPCIVQETDMLRGDIPRSRWVERALIMYNTSAKEKEGEEQKGVKGTDTNLAPTAPTPDAPKTTPFNTSGVSDVED
jgi:hypothetical protein